MDGFKLSTAFMPSWKKLDRNRDVYEGNGLKQSAVCPIKPFKDFVLLALCVEVFDEVLQQIGSFLDFDFIDFKKVLLRHLTQMHVGFF